MTIVSSRTHGCSRAIVARSACIVLRFLCPQMTAARHSSASSNLHYQGNSLRCVEAECTGGRWALPVSLGVWHLSASEAGAISRTEGPVVGTSSYSRHFSEFKRGTFQFVIATGILWHLYSAGHEEPESRRWHMKKGLFTSLQNSGTRLTDVVAEPEPYCPHCLQFALGFGSDQGNDGLDRQSGVPRLQLQWRGWVS